MKIQVLPLDDIGVAQAMALATMLRFRINGFLLSRPTRLQCSVEVMWQGKLSKRMEKASKTNSDYVIIIGGDEFKEQKLMLKNMKTGEQKAVLIEDFRNPEKLSQLIFS